MNNYCVREYTPGGDCIIFAKSIYAKSPKAAAEKVLKKKLKRNYNSKGDVVVSSTYYKNLYRSYLFEEVSA